MSTFDGLVTEFPDIRIDFFRTHPGRQPPLACFLSHVHTDHLTGLESLKSPFVYCSAATREMLLRLERYPCRINYAQGILEARQQTFKHLHKVLKPLPLDTPTCLELQLGHYIQVTLLDANHCPGAVMFLIEGDGKAILYTGDIRSEPWFVNTLARNPCVIDYIATSGLKTLDKIYLDTSHIKDVPFQTKSEGIAELLRKVSHYPKDAVFHFQAWTYGYEDVWVALSKALKSPIHVDEYKMKVYKSLCLQSSENRFGPTTHLCPEAPALVGYMCGNSPHPGCLTVDPNVRIHSCEKGDMCDAAQKPNVVRIRPIIAHLPAGGDMIEIGIGGGGDDLKRETELDLLAQGDFQALIKSICASKGTPIEVQAEIFKCLNDCFTHGRNLLLNSDILSFDDNNSAGLKKVFEALLKKIKGDSPLARRSTSLDSLARVIHFPYSRHSSFPELCNLVETFKPKDIWPCTVDARQWLRDGVSIGSLFGQFCSGDVFEHDYKLEALRQELFGDTDGSLPRISDTQINTDSEPRLESLKNHNGFQPSSPTPTPESQEQLEFTQLLAHRWVRNTIEIQGGWHKGLPCWEAEDDIHRLGPQTLSTYWRSQGGIPEGPNVSSIPTLGSQRHRAPTPTLSPQIYRASTPQPLSQTAQTTSRQHSPLQPESRTPEQPIYIDLTEDEPAEDIQRNGKRNFEAYMEDGEEPDSQMTEKSFASTLSMRHSIIRHDSYRQILDNGGWGDLGLISTSGSHTAPEQEL